MDWSTCFKEKKLLVAEDDRMSREMMKDILEMMNCKVDFAVDGNQVVEMFGKANYDLILMDIHMPDKDGIVATREIRALEQGKKRIPILALSASILHHDKEVALAAGIDDFIEKPVHLGELRAKMSQYLIGKP